MAGGDDPTARRASSAVPAELAPYPAVMALVQSGRARGRVGIDEVLLAFEVDRVPPDLRQRTLAGLAAAGVQLVADAQGSDAQLAALEAGLAALRALADAQVGGAAIAEIEAGLRALIADARGGSAPLGASGSGGAGSGTGRTAALGQLDAVRAVLAASGAELSQEELLDALWLATRLPAGAADAPLERARTVRDDDGVQRATVSHGPVAASGSETSAVAEGPPTTPQVPPGSSGRPPPYEAGPGGAAWALGRGAAAGAGSTGPRGTHGAAGTLPGGRGRPASGLYGAPDMPLMSTVTRRARPSSHRAVPLRVPEGKALPAELSLGRALRPLKQHRPNPLRREMDEIATAAALAETGLPDVVTRPARERWLDLALVVDDGLSMLLWRRLAVELRTLMQRSGAFRAMRVHGLRSRGAGTPALRAKPYAPGAATLPTAAVSDPSGQTLVLVVSDGVGAAWRDGRMTTVLERWAAHGPTAVVHALPPRLWQGSGIRAERWRVTTRRPGAANVDWSVADPVLPPELAAFDGVPVPVLEPAAEPMADWARLLSSPSGTALLPLLSRPRPARGPARAAGTGATPSAGSAGGVASSGSPANAGGLGGAYTAGSAGGVRSTAGTGHGGNAGMAGSAGTAGRAGTTGRAGSAGGVANGARGPCRAPLRPPGTTCATSSGSATPPPPRRTGWPRIWPPWHRCRCP
ncbi:SAV_2336 N-terminal domain-related protein [Streptomyces sp. XD-27]|uniref:SAV_2336 N-terminal domain-related protein n=1 Tax=Streptomyces sp. XD-27 TaxID=3062779 RepID=UPI0026F47106|nr:SAV_2336 N-terminal domain-related protein [Streptomyces sp. XD-27]WKX73219.1 SAV_2336 N-terminal domain-related protein [Streptomyces sp. XD-27]